MTIKLDNARDTFRSHVLSRPLSQPGMEMYNRGQNVRARSNRSLSPMIGRDLKSGIGEDYFSVKREYVVRYEDYLFEASATFDTALYSNPQDYRTTELVLSNSSGGITIIFDTGTDTETELYIDPAPYVDNEDWSGMLDEVVSKINGQFELFDSSIDAFTHAASRPWVARRNANTITITNNLAEESGFNLSVQNASQQNIVTVDDFDSEDSKRKWFKGGLYQQEVPDKAFSEDFVSDRLQITSQGRGSDVLEGWPSQYPLTRTESDLVAENNDTKNNPIQSTIGTTETLDELTLQQDWKRTYLPVQSQLKTSVIDQERWFGRSAETWTRLADLYSVIGLNEAIDKMIFNPITVPTNKSIVDLPDSIEERGYLFINGEENSTGRIEIYDLNLFDDGADPKDHRRGGFMIQDLYQYEDFVDVRDGEYSMFDKENGLAGWMDESGLRVVLAENITTGTYEYVIDLPMVTTEKTYADNYRELVRTSRVDSEMLTTVFQNSQTSFSENRLYYRDESLYSNRGQVSDPSLPSQGIIYTNMLK